MTPSLLCAVAVLHTILRFCPTACDNNNNNNNSNNNRDQRDIPFPIDWCHRLRTLDKMDVPPIVSTRMNTSKRRSGVHNNSSGSDKTRRRRDRIFNSLPEWGVVIAVPSLPHPVVSNRGVVNSVPTKTQTRTTSPALCVEPDVTKIFTKTCSHPVPTVPLAATTMTIKNSVWNQNHPFLATSTWSDRLLTTFPHSESTETAARTKMMRMMMKKTTATLTRGSPETAAAATTAGGEKRKRAKKCLSPNTFNPRWHLP